MFILITIFLFILKFLCLGVLGLFFAEDLELTSSANIAIYAVYALLGVACFFSLLFFLIGAKTLWLIISIVAGLGYFTMYNAAPSIKEIHQSHNIKSRYFKDTTTFAKRIGDIVNIIQKKI
jgi:hypothetical protein